MEWRVSTGIVFLFLLIGSNGGSERADWKGWEHWRNGDIAQAQSVAEGVLRDGPADNKALHLQSLCLFVQGEYREAVGVFSRMDASYAGYGEVGRAMVDAYIHINEPQNAFKLAKQLNIDYAEYYHELAEKRFSCNADRTFVIPFLDEPNLPIPAKYFPWVGGRINGKKVNLGFDTGGPFLVLGKERAGELGIRFGYRGIGDHGGPVTVWRSIADQMEIAEGLIFKNVPVVIMEDLGELAIFGTNILEQFLATADYPNSRFILTPRNRKDLYPQHLALLPKKRETLRFYVWGDHYMFGKGSFNEMPGLNFFFDSGLAALTEIDGQLEQAAFTASKEKLLSWGFDGSKLEATAFLPTEFPLSVAGLVQHNTLVYYEGNLEEDRNFGGVRIDGLISHAFLSKYSWTIDFDKREYIFGIH
ncbi:MAG: retroviral-like aspartic protease family protein [Planctomycetota bacterium]|jgi:hypothetical protein